MLTRGRLLDMWADARFGCGGFDGTNVETIVAFARLVEAAALENAAKSDNRWAHNTVRVETLRARAKKAREAADD